MSKVFIKAIKVQTSLLADEFCSFINMQTVCDKKILIALLVVSFSGCIVTENFNMNLSVGPQ